MKNRLIWFSVLSVLIGFTGGFFLSNTLNRKEITRLKSENSTLTKNKDVTTKSSSVPTLSKEEILAKIAEADKNEDNFAFQKGLGLALYRYAVMKQDKELLGDVATLLERANKLNPDDYDVMVSVGNVYFDIGRGNKKTSSIEKARTFYRKALKKNGNDVVVRNELGLTYSQATPPDYENAVKEFEASLEINPKHEKTLQSLVDALIKLNSQEKAAKYLSTLKQVSPQNKKIAAFEKLLAK